VTSWKAFVTTSAVAFGLGLFLGYPVGMLSMKWTADGELRSLREQGKKLEHDGKVCCDAAYVAIKYRPDCDEVKP